MYIRRRAGRKRSFFRKHRVPLLFLACVGVCLLALALIKASRYPVETARFSEPGRTRAPESMGIFPSAKSGRPVYPYSVIPGGVRNAEELSERIKNDRVVAAHFAAFQVNSAKMTRADETKLVHVSYRMRNRIYWTAKTIKLPKGETLITDGRETARARCGNKVSAAALEPVSENEPPVETFEIPMPEGPDTEISKIIAPFAVEPGEFIPLEPFIPIQYPEIEYPKYQPPEIPPVYNPPEVTEPPSGGFIVPEPGALGLLSSGLVTLLIILYIRKMRATTAK